MTLIEELISCIDPATQFRKARPNLKTNVSWMIMMPMIKSKKSRLTKRSYKKT